MICQRLAIGIARPEQLLPPRACRAVRESLARVGKCGRSVLPAQPNLFLGQLAMFQG